MVLVAMNEMHELTVVDLLCFGITAPPGVEVDKQHTISHRIDNHGVFWAFFVVSHEFEDQVQKF